MNYFQKFFPNSLKCLYLEMVLCNRLAAGWKNMRFVGQPIGFRYPENGNSDTFSNQEKIFLKAFKISPCTCDVCLCVCVCVLF